MNRIALAVGAIAVFAAAIVLYFAMRDDAGAAPAKPKETTTEPARPRPVAPVGRDNPGAPVVSDTAAGEGSAPTAEPPREYVVGDTEVRDHRTGNHAPMDLPSNIHPPSTHRVKSSIVHDISLKMQAVLAACASSVPTEARGVKPRVEGTILIAIKGQQAQVTDATVQLRDVNGDTVDPVKACIQQKTVGITAPAADEPDLEKYSIAVTLALM